MKRKLVCRNGHEWMHRDDPKGPLEMPRCPTCDEIPGIGSRLTMGITPWGFFLLVAWLLVPMAIMAGVVVVFRPGPGAAEPIKWTTTAACLGGLALVVFLLREPVDPKRLEAFVLSQRLRFDPGAPRNWDLPLRNLSLDGPVHGCRRWMAGRFQGTSIKVMDLQCGAGRRKFFVTVAFFEDPIAGLPDFAIHPTADTSKFWNTDLLALLRLRRPQPLQGEPFGRFFRLEGVEPERLEKWLQPKERTRLALGKGWAVQARMGRLAVFRPCRHCPNLELPTFLAVTRHIRHLFLPDSQVETDPSTSTPGKDP